MKLGIRNAPAGETPRPTLLPTSLEPAPRSDAGRVLAVLRRAKGLPRWAIARNAKMTKLQVTYACKYLKQRGLAFSHRTEYGLPDGSGDAVQACWFAGRAPTAEPLVDTSRCRAAMGYGRECGTKLEAVINAFGRVTWQCPACERRNRGVCRQCPRRIVRTAMDGPAPWFCPTCLAARRKARNAIRIATDEYKHKKAALERARVARCKAAGIPHRYDRKSA